MPWVALALAQNNGLEYVGYTSGGAALLTGAGLFSNS